MALLGLVSPGAVGLTDGVTLFFRPKTDLLLVMTNTPNLSAFQQIVFLQ